MGIHVGGKVQRVPSMDVGLEDIKECHDWRLMHVSFILWSSSFSSHFTFTVVILPNVGCLVIDYPTG